MSRMSQGLLVLIFGGLLLHSLPGWAWKRVLSLDKAPDGTHLYHPMSATYEKGRFYVVDTGNRRLISYDLKGSPLKAVNPGGQLKAPLDLDFDFRGRLWVVDRGENALLEIDLSRRSIRKIVLKYKGRRLFPERIVWRGEELYVLDRETGGVAWARFRGEELQVEKVWVPSQRPFQGFLDFKVKRDGIWALERGSHRIYHLSPEGKESFKEIKGGLVYPISFEIAGSRLYILDRYLRKVFVFELKDGQKYLYSFMKWGWSPGRLYLPRELELTPEGLLVVDEGNGRVEVWKGGR